MKKQEKASTAEPKITTIEITCIDCGKARTVGKGEAFQVKRCEECQAKHRKQLRKEYRKKRISNLREENAAVKLLLMEIGSMTVEEVEQAIKNKVATQ